MTVPLQIKPVTESFVEEAMRLQELAIRTLSTEHYSPSQIEAVVESQDRSIRKLIKLRMELLYGGWTGDQLVATASISSCSGLIGGLYVHPDFARQGIGRQMLLTLEKVAVERKYRSLDVTSSLTAVSVYESVGFSRVCSVKLGSKKEPIPCLTMTKSLAYAHPKIDRNKDIFTVVCSLVACVVAVAVCL